MSLLFAESTLDATSLIIIMAVLVCGWLATYFLSQRALKRTVAELRRELDERVNSLAAELRPALPPSAIPAESAIPVQASAAVLPAPAHREEVTPETLLLIAAAVTAFMGKKVRIRSAKMLYAHESFNAWSQQGRVVVQASHNLAQGY
jgi:hypothetical protein